MLVAVKNPPIDIMMRGVIPEAFITITRDFFGKKAVRVTPEDSDRLAPVAESEFYKKTKAGMRPGDYMRACREARSWTLAALGEKLGGVSRQNVSAMEVGRRELSKATIRKLAKIFDVSPERFF